MKRLLIGLDFLATPTLAWLVFTDSGRAYAVAFGAMVWFVSMFVFGGGLFFMYVPIKPDAGH